MATSDVAREKWVDPGVPGIEIVLAEFAMSPGTRAVVIRGDGRLDPTAEAAIARAGFSRLPWPGTVWARPGSTFRKSELLPAFPRLRVVERDRTTTRVRYEGAFPFAEIPDLIDPAAAVDGRPSIASDAAAQPSPSGGSEPAAAENRRANRFQVPYRPASRIGTPIAMIPVNMAEATAKALARIEAEHGAIDEFVARLLGMSVDDMGAVLSPEQVDAIGMSIASVMRGRGFILADQTGLGKGRVLAAIALAARNLGKRVIFITEKANLFSDFWRDLKDIGADKAFGKPFLLNSGSRIVDVTSNGETLFEAMKDDAIRKVIKSERLPDGCGLMMTTYSQFNREGSAKGKFLEAVAEGALVIQDEAHNAAGDSNTRKCLAPATGKAWGTVRSSATFAKTAVNLLSYGDILPPSLRKNNPEELLLAGGNALAEALSQYLAEDGVLLRREHDLSGITIHLVTDDARRERNRRYADALAPILARMAKLSRVVNDEAEMRNDENARSAESGGRKASRENWYTVNFGSRLSPLIRQFLTAITVDLCVERCVDVLRKGYKPVVVVESTMEALMRELSSDQQGDDDDVDVAKPAEEEASDIESVVGTKPPDFKDALNTMLDRIMTLSVKRSPDADPEKVPVEDPFAIAEANAIRRLIEQFPDLPLSPIDDIRDRIEQEGRRLHQAGFIERPWVADEISARRMRVRNGVYEAMPAQDRNATIIGFQSGRINALVLTRAASTGLSLHAETRAEDKSPRVMIELEIPKNVVERVQFWGRVNRRGQVCLPHFETLCSGLPLQMRILAMENRKVEALSANVSASAENVTALDIPDMIDSVGNDVARRLLEDMPSIAERMCIAMRVDPEQAEQELYYVNKFLQRLCLLPSDEADRLFGMLRAEYADAIAALKAKGQAPRGSRELAGNWKEVSREPYEPGDPADGPVFGRPVDLVTMETTIKKEPLDGAAVSRMITEARRRLGAESGNAAGPFFDAQIKAIKASRRKVLTAALSSRMVSVDAALKAREPNAVKAADERLSRLVEILGRIQPGISIAVPDEEGNPTNAVIVDVRAPAEHELHLPGRWSVRFVVPGDAHPKEISIATIMRDQAYTLYPARPGEVPTPPIAVFDRAPRGEVVERRQFLDGNLVKAVAIASESSAGSMVSITDEEGRRRRAVLVRKLRLSSLYDRSKSTTDPANALAVLNAGRPVWTNAKSRTDGLVVRPDAAGFIVEIPKGKPGKAFETEAVLAACGTFRLARDCRAARIRRERLPDLLRALVTDGHSLHYAPPPAARPSSQGGFARRRAGERPGPRPPGFGIGQ